MSGPNPVEAARWLRYAEDDLRAVGLLQREGGSARQACFLAQQAAEKALKAVLVMLGIEFAKTHNLVALRRLLPEDVEGMPSDKELAELTQWASQARYPGDYPEASAADADQALGAGEQLLRTASGVVGA